MWLTAAEDVVLGFNAFYLWFVAEVTARKDFLLAFVAFYRWFCACGVTVGINLLLHFLVFDRLRTPVTVEAVILISLIVFHNWFCKRATAEADFLRSCRKYILSLISYVTCWRSTEIFLYFSSSISTLILWAIDFWSRCFRLVYCFCHWFCAQVTARQIYMLRSFFECHHWLCAQVTAVANVLKPCGAFCRSFYQRKLY